MNIAIAEVLSSLETLQTEQDFAGKFDDTFSKLGYNKFTYASFDKDALKDTSLPDALSDMIYLTNSSPEWVQRYVEKDYASSDPIIRDCFVKRLPIQWTDTYRSNSRSRKESEMMSDAWEHGYQRGLTLPIHGPNGEIGVLSLYSDLADREFVRVTSSNQFEVQVISQYFHNEVQTKLKKEAIVPIPIPLTNREVEILKWTVEGKTAWEIGSILNIAERTVNFHVQNVMEKFGVHNKTQAAAKAVGMGLLDI